MRRPLLWCGIAGFLFAARLPAQQSEQETIRQLTQRLTESERRIQALEQKLGIISDAPAGAATAASRSVSATQAMPMPAGPASKPAPAAEAEAALRAAQVEAAAHGEDMGHNMQIPGGGPILNIRGFSDFNFGTGSIANPLIFPIATNGCETW